MTLLSNSCRPFECAVKKTYFPCSNFPCLLLQAKDAGQRTTIYKRDPDKQYGLKMKTSRSFFSEVERRFDAMPFTLR